MWQCISIEYKMALPPSLLAFNKHPEQQPKATSQKNERSPSIPTTTFPTYTNHQKDMVMEQQTFHHTDSNTPIRYFGLRDEYSTEYKDEGLDESPHGTTQMYHSRFTSTTTTSSRSTTTTQEYVSVTVKSSVNHHCFHPSLHRHSDSEDPEESAPSMDASSQTHSVAHRQRTPRESLKELLEEMEQRDREHEIEFEQQQRELEFLKQHHRYRLNPDLLKDTTYTLRQNHGNANLRHA